MISAKVAAITIIAARASRNVSALRGRFFIIPLFLEPALVVGLRRHGPREEA